MRMIDYINLKVGDIVTPNGTSKDRGKLFKVVELGELYTGYFGRPERENGILVETVDGSELTPTTYMRYSLLNEYNYNKCRRKYQYQALEVVEKCN